MPADLEGAFQVFIAARVYSSHINNDSEINWQRYVSLDEFTETDLLRETAWVILCSGFRERIVRRLFDHISLCFCDWESAAAILDADPICRTAALASFRNATKLKAIVCAAQHIHACSFPVFKQAVLADPLSELERLPYIGRITVWHLAKNLGLNVAKPDRHILRLSTALGFESADHFCAELSRVTGECKKVVDLIIWRFLADNPARSRCFYDNCANKAKHVC